jgi:hypothetical protein
MSSTVSAPASTSSNRTQRATTEEPHPAGSPASQATVVMASTEARMLTGDERASLTLGGRTTYGETVKVEVTPITRSPTPVQASTGRMLALPGSTIAYVTKGGRLRILDRATGARLLLKLHSEVIVDVEAAPIAGGDGMVHVATCGRDGKLIICRVPKSFTEKTATHDVVAEIIAGSPTRFHKLRWSPDGRFLAVITAEGRVVLLDLTSSAWKRSLGKNKSINERDALQAATSFPPRSTAWIDVDFSPDSSQLALLRQPTAEDNLLVEIVPTKGDSDEHPRVPIAAPNATNEAPVQVRFCGPQILATSFRSGLTVHLRYLARFHPILPPVTIRLASDDGDASAFSRMTFDPTQSTLALSHSTRGTVTLVRLEDADKAELVSVYEITADEAVVAFEKQAGDPALFCVLASGIAQVHLPAAASAAPPPLPPAVEGEVKVVEEDEPTAVSTDVSNAVEVCRRGQPPRLAIRRRGAQVTTETAVASDHEDAATRAALPREPRRPVPSSLGTAAPVNGLSHAAAASPSPPPSTTQAWEVSEPLLASIREMLKQIGDEQGMSDCDQSARNKCSNRWHRATPGGRARADESGRAGAAGDGSAVRCAVTLLACSAKTAAQDDLDDLDQEHVQGRRRHCPR